MEPIEGQAHQTQVRLLPGRFSLSGFNSCALPGQRVRDRLDEIRQHPFVLFAQPGLQALQIPCCPFVVAILVTDGASAPGGPDQLVREIVLLRQGQDTPHGFQGFSALTGIVLVDRADQQNLTGAAWIILLELFGCA